MSLADVSLKDIDEYYTVISTFVTYYATKGVRYNFQSEVTIGKKNSEKRRIPRGSKRQRYDIARCMLYYA